MKGGKVENKYSTHKIYEHKFNMLFLHIYLFVPTKPIIKICYTIDGPVSHTTARFAADFLTGNFSSGTLIL
jgi:hypothetical protein